jgi:hypothetical protein
MNDILAWGRQPTTVAGVSALAATVLGLALGQINFAQAVPLLVGAIVSVVLPDNTHAKQDAESLARDVLPTSNNK